MAGWSLEEGFVPIKDGRATERGKQATGGEEGAEGQAGGGVGSAAGEQNKGEEGGGEDAGEEGKEGRGEAEKGGDHGQELDVAEAHAFAVAEGLIDPADDEQEEGGGDDGEEAAEDEVLGAGKKDVALVATGSGGGDVHAAVKEEIVFVGAEEDGVGAGEEEAEEDAGQGEGVGEEVVLPIDDEERDEEEAEEGGSDTHKQSTQDAPVHVGAHLSVVFIGYANNGVGAGEKEPEASSELDGGVAPRDGCVAIAAVCAEGNEREEGNVVVPADGVAAVGAVRARGDDGLAGGKAGDEDVQEAAEKEAQEGCWEGEGEQRRHGMSIGG